MSMSDGEILATLEAFKLDLIAEVTLMVEKRLADLNTVNITEIQDQAAQLEDLDKRIRFMEKKTSKLYRSSWVDRLRGR